MNTYRIDHCPAGALMLCALAAWLVLPASTLGAAEDKFDVLRTKTVVYTNVTVTTKASNYVFILHASGMTSLKVVELPLEAQQQLGYAKAEGSEGSTNSAAAWAKREIAKIDVPQVKALGKQLEQRLHDQAPPQLSALGLIGSKLIYAAVGVALLLWIFQCFCLMLICRKAGHPPGILIWLPVLQVFPLLRAAGMSYWWFLAFLAPLFTPFLRFAVMPIWCLLACSVALAVVSIVPAILWPLRIAKARGKSVWVGILLLLPITNFFAFLYLAFSDGARATDDDEAEPKVMSLQAA